MGCHAIARVAQVVELQATQARLLHDFWPPDQIV
jgi:hypothetical protein